MSRGKPTELPINTAEQQEQAKKAQEAILLQFKLQARRDFLEKHAYMLNAQKILGSQTDLFPVFTAPDRNQPLPQQIKVLSDYLNQLKSYFSKNPKFKQQLKKLNLVLLEDNVDEKAGISRSLGKHFTALIQPEKAAFVELAKSGLQFYWSSQAAQEEFAALLSAYDIAFEKKRASAPQHEDYKNDTFLVEVSHLDVPKLLSLCQYHPYNLTPALNQLYAAKQLSRTACLVELAAKKAQENLLPELPTSIIEMIDTQRITFNQTEDLISLKFACLSDEQTHQKKTPQHIVILLDDSGSMNGEKMAAANKALSNFIKKLPDETLISLQPFNAKTQLVRLSVRDIKNLPQATQNKIFNIPATDSTPLIESLGASAAFLRKKGDDLLISEEALNNSTIVLLTDGQDNSNRTAKNAITFMQNSSLPAQSGVATSLSALDLTGLAQNQQDANYGTLSEETKGIAYGVNGFSCLQLPVIFPIGIGADSDQAFIDTLAEDLSCPNAFINTNSAQNQSNNTTIEKQIDSAFDTLTQIQGRLPAISIGIRYYNPETQQDEIKTLEIPNVFIGRSREIQLPIPKNARSVKIFILSDKGNTLISGHSTPAEARKNESVVNQYCKDELIKLRIAFNQEKAQLIRLSSGMIEFSRRGPATFATPKNADEQTKQKEYEKRLEELKDKTCKAVEKIYAQCTDATLKKDMELWGKFISEQTYSSLNDAMSNSDSKLISRKMIADYTQQRFGQRYVPGATTTSSKYTTSSTSNASSSSSTSSASSSSSSGTPFQILSEPNPLLEALHKSDGLKSTDPDYQKIENLIAQSTSVLTQDNQGNTALHLAAWKGHFEWCQKLISLAIQKGELDQLKKLRNQVQVGATIGETFLDNIRHSEKLNKSQKKTLILSTMVMTETAIFSFIENGNVLSLRDFFIKRPTQPYCNNSAEINRHSKDVHATTPALSMLYHIVKGQLAPQRKFELREFLLQQLKQFRDYSPEIDLLETDRKGNTVLHYAFYHGQFEIAYEIIRVASEQGILEELFAARNNKKEVPHMNFLEGAKKANQNFLNNVGNLSQGISTIINSVDDEGTLPTFSDEDIEWISSAYSMMQDYDACQSIRGFLKNTLTPEQQAELAHLEVLKEKTNAGYSTYTWLKNAPFPNLFKLKKQCESTLSNLFYASAPEDQQQVVKELETQLLALIKGKTTVEAIERFINETLSNPNASIFQSNYYNSPVKELFEKAQKVIAQYVRYQKGDTETHITDAHIHLQQKWIQLITKEQNNQSLCEWIGMQRLPNFSAFKKIQAIFDGTTSFSSTQMLDLYESINQILSTRTARYLIPNAFYQGLVDFRRQVESACASVLKQHQNDTLLASLKTCLQDYIRYRLSHVNSKENHTGLDQIANLTIDSKYAQNENIIYYLEVKRMIHERLTHPLNCFHSLKRENEVAELYQLFDETNLYVNNNSSLELNTQGIQDIITTLKSYYANNADYIRIKIV